MTLSDVKLDCLKMMFEDATVETLADNSKAQNMLPSINRALERCHHAQKLPIVQDTITTTLNEDGTTTTEITDVGTHELNEKIGIYVFRGLPRDMKDTDAFNANIPSYILNLIPYYVKGELYEEDDPALAALARNIFEQTLMTLPTPICNSNLNQKKILSVYRSCR